MTVDDTIFDPVTVDEISVDDNTLAAVTVAEIKVDLSTFDPDLTLESTNVLLDALESVHVDLVQVFALPEHSRCETE